MECPKCQFENFDGIKFCGECGYDLRQTQGPISEVYSHPQSYTPKHLADKILTTRSAIEGERKMVTVLFADVANYTSMSEKLGPEGVHQIMDGCFKILMDEIHNHEGTINQFTGDGVMALFGAPIAHEEHAQKACYAALSIQESLQDYTKLLNDKFGVDFNMRIGINSGLVVVGSIGDDLRMDYTAIGDTTNLAARMESLAPPGSVLVSKNTYEKVNPFFEFEDLGKYEVKGKKEQQEAYKLNRQKDRTHLGFTRQIYSEMVGRDAELNRLELQVLKAVNGEGSIVNVIGEAGIGKSRLIAELKQTDVIKKVALREGRAISMGKGLSFYPVIDIYKNWAKIKEGDSDATAIQKLERSIRNVTSEEMDDILPFIATLMGIKLTGRYAERVKGIDGEALEKLILKSVKDLLIKSSELMPIAIVIEDLHWADLSTIELLESLFRLAESQRILFINVFRPRYTETGVRIVQTVKEKFSKHYVEIELQPLNEKMSETLINNMLNISGLPHDVRNRIIGRSGGNPFFIEEVVRSFIDDGVILRKNGGFEVTDKIDSVVIPQTINDVLTARLDRLEQKTKDLVKTASVIGRSFFYKILSEVAKTLDDIDKRLEDLKEIQLIRDRIRLEEIEYLFKHALTQEAAYESLLVQKRKELHHSVAESIERVFGDKLHEFYGMLAYHYSKGENPDKAEEYMIKAGEEALRSSASSEAISYYQEALRIYLKKFGKNSDPKKISMIETNIAFAFYFRNEYISATKYFESVLEKFSIKPPKVRVIIWLKFLLDFSSILPRLYFPFMKSNKKPKSRDNEISRLYFFYTTSLIYTDALRSFTEGIAALRRSLKFDVTKLEYGDAVLFAGSGWFSFSGFSERLSKKILDYAETNFIKNSYRTTITLSYVKTLHNYLFGNWNEILAPEYEDAIFEQHLKAGENFWIISNHLGFCALAKVYQGKFRAAKTLKEKLSNMKDACEYEQAKTNYLFVNTVQLVLRRELQEAKISVKEFETASSKTSSNAFILLPLGLKIQIDLLLNDLTAAKNSIEQAEIYYKKESNITPIYASFFLAARFLFYIRLFEESLNSKDKASVAKYRKGAYMSGRHLVKNSKNYAGGRTEALELMGVFHWLSNKQHKAIKWWQKAIKEGEKLSARPELARVFMQIGIRLQEEGSNYKDLNGISAAEYLNRAKTMFEDMDLKWDLDILEMLATVT